MSLKLAFQMDPMETIKPQSDSSFLAMLEAQARGYEVFHYTPHELSLISGRLTATLRPVTVQDNTDDYYAYGAPISMDLTEFDIIFLRQNPPFNMAYITTTYLLEKIKDRVLIINDPTSVRDCSEKIYATQFPQFMAPTLISSNRNDITHFINEHGEVILKSLYGFAGGDIEKVTKSNNINEILDKYKPLSHEPIMVQKFLPAIKDGDKRIMMIDGEHLEQALNRIPPEGDIRAAMALGGRGEKVEITERDLEICNTVGPDLRRRGLFFAGLDIIGGHLTEINITSPTGLRYINRLYGTQLEKIFWDKLEKKYKEFKSKH